ncbi:MAG: hypothetical protein ACK4TA_04010 [Saprospiraceae bacterium]
MMPNPLAANRVARYPRVTRLILPAFLLLATLATYLVRHHVFFWDTVQLGAKHAYFYYEHQFSQFLLPTEIDSGHPPTFGMYLAFLWIIFGKSLAVSHFAMLPFLYGIVYFLWRIGKIISDERYVIFLLLFALADPTLAAQCLLISPDVILTCFFLMGVFAILQKLSFLKALAMLGLAMISMRGMMTVAALFLFNMIMQYHNWKAIPRLLLQTIPYYIPAGLFALAFLGWHYAQTGWIGYHPDSPWAPSFAKVNLQGFIKNIIILGWRMLDFGRVFIWMILLYLLFQQKRYRLLLKQAAIRPFYWLLILCFIVLTPTLLLYQSLSAHRYLLPIYLALTLFTFAVLFAFLDNKKASIIYAFIIIVGLASGNLWRYPDTIAQGWDASLAHLPYYKVRQKMLEYLDNQDIPFNAIGTAFPEIGSRQFRDLSDRVEGFAEKDLATQTYILYSNVMNDFSDAEVDTLQQHWTPLQTFAQGGVRMVLYTRNPADN